MKHYKDIMAMRPSFMDDFHEGDIITITEKIDGANASFDLNENKTEINAMSRKTLLDESNTLRGYYNYAKSLEIRIFDDNPDYLVFGEWLVKHSIKYPESAYNKFYVFDIYDKKTENWMKHEDVVEFAEKYNLLMVPVFYVGPFISWEHVESFVGQTKMGGDRGEGVVVKNQTTLNTFHDSRHQSYVKIVAKEFKEAHTSRQKTIDPEKLAAQEYARELTSTIVTPARVIKLLHKMVDNGIIPEDWNTESMKDIAKNLPKLVFEDCVKEEKETVDKIGELFGKTASGITMNIVKEELAKKNQF